MDETQKPALPEGDEDAPVVTLDPAEDEVAGIPSHTLTVGDDGLVARLCVDRLDADAEVDLDAFVANLESSHRLVDVSRDDVAAAVDLARGAGAEHLLTVVAQGRAAVDGEDGRVEWLGEFFETHAIQRPDGSVDHYHHTKCSVYEGQQLARIHPPTTGTAGRNVHGEDLPAKPGEPVVLQLESSVARDPHDEGLLVAARGGMVDYDARRVRISEVFEVDAVNWATGSIDFEGSVRVRKDVDPRFEVFGGASVYITGTVESAQVESDGRVEVGGVLGQGRGQITSGADMILAYARETRLHCGGRLVARRELIWCEGEVAEDLLVDEGRIVGGHWLVGGTLYAKELGSREEVTTEIKLGVSLEQSRALRKLARERKRLQDRLMQFGRQFGPRIRAAQGERDRQGTPDAPLPANVQVLVDRQTAMRREARRARRKELVLRKRLRRRELRSQVLVKQTLHAGVRFEFDGGDHVLNVRQAIPGPVRVQLGEEGIEVERI